MVKSTVTELSYMKLALGFIFTEGFGEIGPLEFRGA